MDRKEKAFEFAADASKQMITLATGIIALTVTLLKDILRDPAAGTVTLNLAWLAFGLSVLFGLWFLLALTGSLASSKPEDKLTINSSNARIPMFGQVISFVLGLFLTIAFGACSLPSVASRAKQVASDTSAAVFENTAVTKELSVGPFADGDTTVSSVTWNTFEQAVVEAVKRQQSNTPVDGILLMGDVDQGMISGAAATRLSVNQALADARAEAFRSRLAKRFGDTVKVFAIAPSAVEPVPMTSGELHRGRRVDVYFLSRTRGVRHDGK